MPATAQPSYSHGVSSQALIGETIGENLRRVAARFGDREAMVDVPSGRRWTYRQLDADTDTLARGLLAAGIGTGERVGIWSPNCPEWVLLQYATAKMGAILVNINPAYRTHELAYVLRQAGVKLLVSAESFKTSDYRAMVGEVRGDLPGLEDVIFISTEGWDKLLAAGVAAADAAAAGDEPDALAAREATLAFDDPINIQYTSGTTGFPKGATLSHHNILNNGFFIGEYCRYTEADRVAIPVPFYHCFGMVLGNLACTTHGACIVIPAPGFEPAATLRAVQQERCTSLYGVPTMFIAELALPDFASYDLSSLRTGIMAGLAVPGRGDEARGQRDAHGRGHDRLRDDRDLPGVRADPGRRGTRAPGVHGRPGAPAPRGEDHPPGDRAGAAPGHARRDVHPRLLGDARLLGRPGADRGGDRRGPLDAHRRPGGDGRGGLPEHRRPDQGPGHPRRGEHLPARGGGVPARPPADRGRAGDRRTGREVRRGAVRLDPGPRRRAS